MGRARTRGRVSDPPAERQRILDVVRQTRPRLAQDPQVERLLDVERARAELVALYRAGEIPRHLLPTEIERILAPEQVAGREALGALSDQLGADSV